MVQGDGLDFLGTGWVFMIMKLCVL